MGSKRCLRRRKWTACAGFAAALLAFACHPISLFDHLLALTPQWLVAWKTAPGYRRKGRLYYFPFIIHCGFWHTPRTQEKRNRTQCDTYTMDNVNGAALKEYVGGECSRPV